MYIGAALGQNPSVLSKKICHDKLKGLNRAKDRSSEKIIRIQKSLIVSNKQLGSNPEPVLHQLEEVLLNLNRFLFSSRLALFKTSKVARKVSRKNVTENGLKMVVNYIHHLHLSTSCYLSLSVSTIVFNWLSLSLPIFFFHR